MVAWRFAKRHSSEFHPPIFSLSAGVNPMRSASEGMHLLAEYEVISWTSVGESWRGSWRKSWALKRWNLDSFIGSDAIDCTDCSVHRLGMNSGKTKVLPPAFVGMLCRKEKHFAKSVLCTVRGPIQANGARAPPFFDLPKDARPVIDTSSNLIWLLCK